MVVLDGQFTQETLAQVIGITQARVSDFFSRGIFDPSMNLGQAIAAYCSHLREHAAGRMTPPDILEERRRLIRARREKLELETRLASADLVPAELLAKLLGDVASRVHAGLDSIPGRVKRRWPKISAEQLELIRAETVAVRNSIAAMELPDIDPALLVLVPDSDDADA